MHKQLLQLGLALFVLIGTDSILSERSFLNPETAYAQSSNKIIDPAHPEKGPQDPKDVQIDYSIEPVNSNQSLSFTQIAISIGLGLSAGFGWYWFYKNRSD